MTAEERLEKIEQYLQGRLSTEQAATFEAEIQADPALAEEVALERDLLDYLGETDVQAFRATVQKVHKQKREARIIPLAARRTWALAASVLVLVVTGYFVLDRMLAPSPQDLYQAYFETPAAEEFMAPSIFQSRDGVSEKQDLQGLGKVAALYRNGQYAEALAAMQSIEPSDAAAHAYQLGVLYLVNDQPEAALDALSAGEAANPDGARWYRALALLGLDRPAEAREPLEQLRAGSSIWREEAVGLLRKLK